MDDEQTTVMTEHWTKQFKITYNKPTFFKQLIGPKLNEIKKKIKTETKWCYCLAYVINSLTN